MITQTYLSGHLGRYENLTPTADDARWAGGIYETHNITGLTLYREGDFFCVLEGSDEATILAAQDFEADPRVSKAEIMYKNYNEQREFNNYLIGFDSADFSDDVPNSFCLTPKTLQQALPDNPSPVLKALTNGFAKVHNLRPLLANENISFAIKAG